MADTFDFIAGKFQRPFLTVCFKCIHCFPFVINFYIAVASLWVFVPAMERKPKELKSGKSHLLDYRKWLSNKNSVKRMNVVSHLIVTQNDSLVITNFQVKISETWCVGKAPSNPFMIEITCESGSEL